MVHLGSGLPTLPLGWGGDDDHGGASLPSLWGSRWAQPRFSWNRGAGGGLGAKKGTAPERILHIPSTERTGPCPASLRPQSFRRASPSVIVQVIFWSRSHRTAAHAPSLPDSPDLSLWGVRGTHATHTLSLSPDLHVSGAKKSQSREVNTVEARQPSLPPGLGGEGGMGISARKLKTRGGEGREGGLKNLSPSCPFLSPP